ncbi:hypothetical protein [Clostridium intestinale]|uniref:Lipoprotein n=1 Tax=Clostridium intestinale DSM 6191 TaxID=1121320 RepID=A0A1M5ZR30_9CLOT|nr:hypothetical protein [Clostridium intestinale]SHI26569.1 hypothetical protein SAMN02745941_03265 [Clostridium intestinale DSM 6191]
MIRSKKVIVTILSLILSTSIFIGCGKKENIENSNKIETKEITSIEELPKENTKIEFLAYGTSIEKRPEEFSKYKELHDFVDNFSKGNFGVDYTNEESIFASKKYLSNELQERNEKNYENIKSDIVDKKKQIDYVKTNIDSIIFSNYSGNYFVDCTIYTFVRNDPSVKEQNKYYQTKYYMFITEENNKLVLSNGNGYGKFRAEEIPSTSPAYMIDEGTDDDFKTTYVAEKELSKFEELDSVKNNITQYYTDYYSINYTSDMNKFKSELLKFISDNYKSDIGTLIDNRIKDINENKFELEFKSVNYRVINYTAYDNKYYIALDVIYNIKNTDETIKTPFLLDLTKENDEWKILKQRYLGENFIIKQNK